MSKKRTILDKKTKKKLDLRKFSIFNIIFLAVLSTLIVISLSLSQYNSDSVLHQNVKVAVMANDVIYNAGQPAIGYPGCEYIYTVDLTNKEDKVCEVSQKFTMQFEKGQEENLPLTWGLYKDEQCTIPLNKTKEGIYDDEEFYFEGGVEKTKTVYLKISWPKEKNQDYYSYEIDYFDFDIVIKQID